jgi:hypothetical protein
MSTVLFLILYFIVWIIFSIIFHKIGQWDIESSVLFALIWPILMPFVIVLLPFGIVAFITILVCDTEKTPKDKKI